MQELQKRKPPMKIVSDRLTFKVRAADQTEELFNLVVHNRKHLQPWMPWEKTTQKSDDTAKFINMMIEDWDSHSTFDYSMFENKSGKMIGSFGFHSINWNKMTCHLGYWIDSNHEGKGFITEGIKKFEEIAKELGFHRIIITCDTRNKKSYNTAVRNAYQLEAKFIDETVQENEFRDTYQFVKLLKSEHNLPHLFSIKRYNDKDQFFDLIENHVEIVYENEINFNGREIVSASEKEKLKALREGIVYNFYDFKALFYKEQLAGWMWGYQDNIESYYMVNSAILPEYRRRGLYSTLLNLTLSELRENGFQKIWSRHIIVNNEVIVPKLKAGFNITGTEINDAFGTLVHLTYYTNEVRRKVMKFRSGILKPDEQIKKLLKL